MTPHRIICLGEGMIEERLAADGTLTSHYGGDALNIAIHLARLGNDVAFATAVGGDEQSDKLVKAWSDEGLDTSLVFRHPNRTVGRYRITVDDKGERFFSYDRSESAARLMLEMDTSGRIEEHGGKAECFIFSLISLAILSDEQRNSLLEVVRQVRAKSCLVVFDANYRPALWESEETARHWHSQAVKACDIGLPTLEDEIALFDLPESTSVDDVATHWRKLGCDEVVVKAGPEGCRLPDGELLGPPAALSPVDTSGAGDAFDAAYLDGRLNGLSPALAAVSGHRLAGWTIMRSGAIPAYAPSAPYGEVHDR